MRGVQPQVQQVHGRERLSPRHSARTRIEHESDSSSDTFQLRLSCILTNDWEMSEKEVIEYYSAVVRERDFLTRLNNDFWISHLPCFRSLTRTLCSCYLWLCVQELLYRYLVNRRSSATSNPHQLKKFIYHFISVLLPNG